MHISDTSFDVEMLLVGGVRIQHHRHIALNQSNRSHPTSLEKYIKLMCALRNKCDHIIRPV